jgi:hypothetical protein
MYLLKLVPANSCAVLFSSLTGESTLYQSGWHWLGFLGLFQSSIYTTLQDKYTDTINLMTYHDHIKAYPILTASKLPITIDCSAHMKIIDPLLAVTSIGDIDSMVDAICKSQLRNNFSTLDLDQIITTQATLQLQLLRSINQDLIRYGVSCVGFTLTRVQLPLNIQEAVTKITSEQMQQRCAIIEAQTNQKVIRINLALDQQKQQVNLAMGRLDQALLMQKLNAFQAVDSQFNLNHYFSSYFRSEAYSKCNTVTLHDGINDPKVPIILPS